MMRVRRPRKGFAIVLVAALAGLVFLLGASLVAVSQLQSASANYDQRVRLAREHARASLDMAIAELQQKLGPDTAVSYTADTGRVLSTDDFDVGPTESLPHPFWTGARNSGTDFWLVTREVDGGTASPTDSTIDDPIVLVSSANTVSAAALEVQVPREPIIVSGVDGYDADDNKTIGHYAYWVGDLGVKASYALRDRSGDVSHDGYEDIVVDPDGGVSDDEWYPRQERLRQMRLSVPSLGIVDTNEADISPTNPERIDSFVNDFQFRDRYGSSSDTEYLLKGLTENEVGQFFHDFTPLSKGLLVNTEGGGFRDDLTFGATGNDSFDAYSQLAKDSISTATNYIDDSFPMKAKDSNGPAIHPVLTQFNLNYSIYLEPVNQGSTISNIRLEFSAGIELWNPFISSIIAESIRIEVTGLPRLEIVDWADELGELSKIPNFLIPANVDGQSQWRPGQIAAFSGPTSSNASGSGPYVLTFGTAYVNDPSSRVEILDLDHTVSGAYVSGLPFAFVNSDGSSDPATLVVKLYLNDSDELLASYVLPAEFITDDPDPREMSPFGNANASFGFSWEIEDEQLSGFGNYHPFEDSLESDALESFDPLVDGTVNVQPNFELASSTLLLGANPTENDTEVDLSYDLPLLQLPKQELLAVSHLGSTYGDEWDPILLGEPGHVTNSLFDTHYFSGIGKGTGDWAVGDQIANSGYMPRAGATKATLQSVDSAEDLFVHGMFNVNSTSIEAWSALLKGSPASASAFWFDFFEALEGDANTELDTELYLMFNYPQGAEARFVADLNPTVAIDQVRASLSQSMFAFEATEIKLLAKHIVSNIRKRHQGVTPYNVGDSGAFESLQDFVDSGVLKAAIVDAHNEIAVSGNSVFSPSWVVANSNREFRQSTVLNLITPYLSVRSDTFLVRAYGDAVSPSDSTKIWARAYCEAIVQRTHEMHEDSGLGRRFEIVAFRWLSPSEI